VYPAIDDTVHSAKNLESSLAVHILTTTLEWVQHTGDYLHVCTVHQ
jgi:hypothetical protein